MAENHCAKLMELFAALEARSAALRAPPPLGYGGVSLKLEIGETWHAFGGTVVWTRRDGAGEVRADPERAFERALLASAPVGLLPPGLDLPSPRQA